MVSVATASAVKVALTANAQSHAAVQVDAAVQRVQVVRVEVARLSEYSKGEGN